MERRHRVQSRLKAKGSCDRGACGRDHGNPPIFSSPAAVVVNIRSQHQSRSIDEADLETEMPIYEFYCSACHVLFNFYSDRINTEARPSCPRCKGNPLERRPARFAMLKHSGSGEPDPFGDLDEDRLAGVMESMMGELEHLGENDDPRQMAQLFRRFGQASGLEMGPRMEELMSRLEAGEDPDVLEQEMEGQFDDEEGLEEFFRMRKRAQRSSTRPRVDETLYFLDS